MSAAGHRLRQHPVLDGVDLFLDRFQHRHVVVDDEIENRVEDEVLALCQRGRAGFPMLAHGGVGGRGAVPDADDVACRRTDAFRRTRRGRSISWAVRATMKSASPYCSSFGRWCACSASSMARSCSWNSRWTRCSSSRLGLEQADPDDMTVLARPLAGFVDGNIGDAMAVDIDAGRDDAGFGTIGTCNVAGKSHWSSPLSRPGRNAS